jgi:hypothetical protein
MELNFVIESLVKRRKEKKRKEQTICFILKRKMQGDLFIPESWTKMTTWVEEIQFMAMKITKGRPN